MHRVIVVGNSLFGETLCEMLAASLDVEIIPTVAHALAMIAKREYDAVIVADTGNASLRPEFLDLMCTNLPVIHASLSHDFLEIFSYQRVNAALSDLLGALDALSTTEFKRNQHDRMQTCLSLLGGDIL